eukprot:CAMPEP_0206169482 /NCGR_PEP_ID=MMETSP1474-20131121/35855_1 /ASSEMBLY_ACC=CAM_ASM_001110 /TAXON_ID=97495 /ORGANISM="Imantonia sp., Strain RCC918" /LENGTH=159 /DNA_ID=CAMNT_0053575561 /DNA_START=113 /DNA_END=592 /DNA_ORIENTATION=-
MSSAHLKTCLTSTQRFDFLSEIVQRVADVEPEKDSKRGRPSKKLEEGESPVKGSSRRGKRGRPTGSGGTERKLKDKISTFQTKIPPPVAADKSNEKILPSLRETIPEATTTKPGFPSSVPSVAGLPPVNLFNSDSNITLPPLPDSKSSFKEEEEEDYDV